MVVTNSNKSQSQTRMKQGVKHLNPSTKKPQVFGKKRCKFCGEEFQILAPSHIYCSDRCQEMGHSDNYYKRNYKITLQEAMCLYEKQGGRCAICGSRGFRMNPNSIMKLVVDHDHSTGEVRGLLCHNCNRALGLLQDSTGSLQAAIDYLESATTISEESTPKQEEAVDRGELSVLLDDIV